MGHSSPTYLNGKKCPNYLNSIFLFFFFFFFNWFKQKNICLFVYFFWNIQHYLTTHRLSACVNDRPPPTEAAVGVVSEPEPEAEEYAEAALGSQQWWWRWGFQCLNGLQGTSAKHTTWRTGNKHSFDSVFIYIAPQILCFILWH